MEWLTIGAFAKACRLSPKAQRLYDELELLRPAPDLRLHDAHAGDRYLLCSDGLSGVVPDDRIRTLLTSAAAPDEAVLTLVAEANTAGGPDNVSCVVADVVEAAD